MRVSTRHAEAATLLRPDDTAHEEHVVPGLYWSTRGEIACAKHAPERDSERWVQEEWREITALRGATPEYQCQHCYPWPPGRRPTARASQ
jgi:hypothetical protein